MASIQRCLLRKSRASAKSMTKTMKTAFAKHSASLAKGLKAHTAETAATRKKAIEYIT
ncbi:MbeB family mobilization protein [Paraburkholderia oxyphila]|uniref:MbeB family mobilization protein n=1 Tax=Paraburkholderia oxyphila TaxID=614212 RepID=UPI00389913B6